jgi:excisionase family DNA binding protein
VPFLTVKDICKELGFDRPEPVLAWIHAGELAAIDVSRPGASRACWRIRREDLDAFLLRRQSKPPVPDASRKPRRRLQAAGPGRRYF